MSPDGFMMRREKVAELSGREVWALDTIAHVADQHRGQIVATGSHGGISSGGYAGRVALEEVFFNGAGIGKGEAGTDALPYLQQQGIAAGTVAHESAVIGNALETWQHGIISRINSIARMRGFREGEALHAALERIYGTSP